MVQPIRTALRGLSARPTWLCGFIILLALENSVWGDGLAGFVRGDCNGSGQRSLADPLLLLEHLFIGTPPPGCLDACDMNDDGGLGLPDALHGLGAMFSGGAGFPDPNRCGSDPTRDSLLCETATCTLAELVETRVFTLETGRIGLPYEGDLPSHYRDEVIQQRFGGPPETIQEGIRYTDFCFPLDQYAPPGLELDPAGTISGAPVEPGLHSFQVLGRLPSGGLVRYDVDLPVFTAAETEFIPDQGFNEPGGFSVSVARTAFDFLHQLPWPPRNLLYDCPDPQAPPPEVQDTKELQIFYPLTPALAPLLLFHHGWGFEAQEYDVLLTHFASYGTICVSVNDPFSYEDYTDYYCWGGHEEAARVLLATREVIRQFDQDPRHPLYRSVDWRRVFYGGHSRGGASAIVAAELDRDTRGVLAFQATDAKKDSWIGLTNRWVNLPDVPILNISAEQDFDVSFPIAERLLERFSGPASMVALYGACHGFTTDDSDNGCLLCNWDATPSTVDRCRYIPRQLQLDLIKLFGTAFLRRYGFGDLSPENLLYGDEFQGSPYAGVAYKRNLSNPLRIDSFDGFPMNLLGFENHFNGFAAVDQGSCYDDPFPIPDPLETINNLVLVLPREGVALIQWPIGTTERPLDLGSRKRLTFRVKNHDVGGLVDNFGFSWLNFTLTLVDSEGDAATLLVNDYLPQEDYHPEPIPLGIEVRMKYQRFLTVTIPIDDFLANNAALDLDRLVDLRCQLESDGSENVTPRLGLDDIQFE